STIGKGKADKELVEVAEALIDKKTAPFDADNYKDHYEAALRELIARKLKSKGKKITTDVEPPEKRAEGSNVVDLMSALKKSLETGAAKPKAAASRRKAS
ncbi:MAG: Ku protein, partial [Devosia nanyangense]|nr:Ku protein [Devosia nanyangense]